MLALIKGMLKFCTDSWASFGTDALGVLGVPNGSPSGERPRRTSDLFIHEEGESLTQG